MRFRLLVAAVAVLVASCGGAETTTTPAPTEAPVATDSVATTSPSSEAPGTTSAGQDTEAPPTEAPTSERPPTEGPAAPAFNTVLSDGTSFSLADEAKPVYMVFWAEW